MPRKALARDPESRFELMLARDLGKTRAELRALLPTSEFVDWIALYNLEAAERAAEANKQRGSRKGR